MSGSEITIHPTLTHEEASDLTRALIMEYFREDEFTEEYEENEFQSGYYFTIDNPQGGPFVLQAMVVEGHDDEDDEDFVVVGAGLFPPGGSDTPNIGHSSVIISSPDRSLLRSSLMNFFMGMKHGSLS